MIVFESLLFQNFLSVGNNPVTISLNESKTTLIHGTNGSGKSTVLDALCYALFNKPFRTINLPQLINSSNKKGLLTEVHFSIGKTKYSVERGIKPKVFKIYKDGEQLDATAADKDNQAHLEQNILKMNMKTFIQVVILGSGNYMPFMQLSSSARRDCVEDFLDIKVFSTMSILAKERLKGLKDRGRELKGDISNLEYKLELQQDRIQEVEQQSISSVDDIQKSIETHKVSIKELMEQITKCQTDEELLMQEIGVLMNSSPKKMHQEYNNITVKLQSKLDHIKTESNFYKDNDSCPSCSQSITEELRNTFIKQKEEQSQEYNTALGQAQEKLDEFSELLLQIQSLEVNVQRVQNDILIKNKEIQSYNNQIAAYETKLISITNDSSSIDKEKGKLESLKEQLEDLKKRSDVITNEIYNHDIVVNLLKDSGIKTQIVRKYMPVMNKNIRKYLTDLDFPVLFTLDDEFNEKVASPMYQDFSYASFSEGQKSRIDIALMLTWREIGRVKNSVNTNLLMLDEVFSSSLDDAGKENLLALIRYGLTDTNVMVVDHTLSAEFKDKFDRTVEVSKVGGFSKYD